MKLRSIPPANRKRSIKSSMRAATNSGYTFVGRQRKEPKEEVFKAKVIKPDLEAQKVRNLIRNTIAENNRFWIEEIERWEEEFGVNKLSKLIKEGK